MYSVYNHTYHPRHYGDPVAEYWHLLNAVTLWDVGVERQIEISGPDAFEFTNMMVPRDMTKCAVRQAKYVFVTARTAGSSTTRSCSGWRRTGSGSRSPTATWAVGAGAGRTTRAWT